MTAFSVFLLALGLMLHGNGILKCRSESVTYVDDWFGSIQFDPSSDCFFCTGTVVHKWQFTSPAENNFLLIIDIYYLNDYNSDDKITMPDGKRYERQILPSCFNYKPSSSLAKSNCMQELIKNYGCSSEVIDIPRPISTLSLSIKTKYWLNKHTRFSFIYLIVACSEEEIVTKTTTAAEDNNQRTATNTEVFISTEAATEDDEETSTNTETVTSSTFVEDHNTSTITQSIHLSTNLLSSTHSETSARTQAFSSPSSNPCSQITEANTDEAKTLSPVKHDDNPTTELNLCKCPHLPTSNNDCTVAIAVASCLGAVLLVWGITCMIFALKWRQRKNFDNVMCKTPNGSQEPKPSFPRKGNAYAFADDSNVNAKNKELSPTSSTVSVGKCDEDGKGMVDNVLYQGLSDCVGVAGQGKSFEDIKEKANSNCNNRKTPSVEDDLYTFAEGNYEKVTINEFFPPPPGGSAGKCDENIKDGKDMVDNVLYQAFNNGFGTAE